MLLMFLLTDRSILLNNGDIVKEFSDIIDIYV
jgi:hypothetical protein